MSKPTDPNNRAKQVTERPEHSVALLNDPRLAPLVEALETMDFEDKFNDGDACDPELVMSVLYAYRKLRGEG